LIRDSEGKKVKKTCFSKEHFAVTASPGKWFDESLGCFISIAASERVVPDVRDSDVNPSKMVAMKKVTFACRDHYDRFYGRQ